MTAVRVALKIDVDTYRGAADGAARLAFFLRAERIPASFFVSLGPDNSGWAALRVFRHTGFFRKMRRTSAWSVYGWRTAFSGTLWPARPIGSSFADSLRRWKSWGFEVSPHGFDHILWHDQAASWSADRAAEEWAKIDQAYRQIFGEAPQSSAAPGWQAGTGTWRVLDEAGLLYHSDTRGDEPYWPEIDGIRQATLEIPTTLPTWDEMLAWDGVSMANLIEETWKQVRADRVNVWTIHAEFEGSPCFALFRRFIEQAKSKGVEWIFLPAWAQSLKNRADELPRAGIAQGTRPGRAGAVTVQSALSSTKSERSLFAHG
ncbi:MAG TPA: polysaccharide deacetylase family protein [Elusimicrobiota bacterium]|nr:polysaccharide deacetylase family protein [Elusimicrobiota bacterium]